MKLCDKFMIFGGGFTIVYLGFSLIKTKILAKHLDNYNECCVKIVEEAAKTGNMELGKVDGLLHLK